MMKGVQLHDIIINWGVRVCVDILGGKHQHSNNWYSKQLLISENCLCNNMT